MDLRTLCLRSARVALFAILVTVLFSAVGNETVAQCVYGYGNMTVTSPTAGQQFNRGDNMTIAWRWGYQDYYYRNTYRLDYSTDGGSTWTEIASNIYFGTTTYSWKIPSTVTPGTNWRIRVTEVADNYYWYCALNYAGMSNTFTVNKGCFPPTFSTQPTSRNACINTSTTFTVKTDADSPTYEWMKDGVVIATTQSASYTIASVQLASAGSYSVRVRDICGAVNTSSPGTLNVLEPPKITVQPVPAMTICENAVATMSVTAEGPGLTYQWRRNGTNITGATASSYTIGNSLPVTSEGSYTCVVSGTCSPAATSNPCVITVTGRPKFTTEPEAVTVCPGSSVTLTSAATGTALSYQWYRNGKPVTGGNQSALTLNNYAVANDGRYQVVVTSDVPNPSNCQVAAYSREVVVSSYKSPSITVNPPSSMEACTGGSMTLSVEAAGFDLRYQWLRNGTPITGATQNALTLDNLTKASAGSYSVRVTGTCNLVASSTPCVVTVLERPVVTTSPTNAALVVGGRLELTVAGTDVREVQWLRNSQPIPGATEPTYTVESVRLSDAGSYSAIIRNTCGAAVSQYARVTVKDPSLDRPELALSQTTADFGEVPIGYDKTMTLESVIGNSGSAPMQVLSITTTGTAFSIANGPATPFTLQPGDFASVELRVMPSALGGATGSLQVSTNAPAPDGAVALTATSVLRYSHAQTARFEDTEVGMNKEVCIPVTNTSTVPVSITAITPSGVDAGEFSVSTAMPVNLAAGATSDVCITFRPTSVGDKSISLAMISATGGNSSATVNGRGIVTVSVASDELLSGVTVYPNPSSGAVTIDGGTVMLTRVDIVDVAGRSVAQLSGGQRFIRWDGRATSGSPVSTGTYTIVLHTSNGQTAAMPLSIVR